MVRIICSILLSLFYANALNAQEPLLPVAVSEADTLPHVYLQEVKVKGKNLYKKNISVPHDAKPDWNTM